MKQKLLHNWLVMELDVDILLGMFFILSIKHSPANGNALWWGPDNCGYVQCLTLAGRYTDKQVGERPDYYNNGKSTAAVECEAAKAVTHRPFLVEWMEAKKLTQGKVLNT